MSASTKIRSRSATAGAHKPPKRKANPYPSRAVGKALEALDILKRPPGGLALNQLARKLGLTKSSAFRLLQTLEVAGYLARSADGRYTVTLERRGTGAQFVDRLIRAASEPLKEMSRQFRETVSLAVLFDNHIEVVFVVESPLLIRMGNTVGRILPPNASSLGKAITAFQPEEVREKLLRSYGLARFTPGTITDALELKQELDQTRARGYATDLEESTPDGYCFAAPVFSNGGDVQAAISMSLPKTRAADHDQQRLIEAVLRAATRISEKLASS